MMRLKGRIIIQSSRILEQCHDFWSGELMCPLDKCSYITGPWENQIASSRDTKDPR